MSWSVDIRGKAGAIRAVAATQLAQAAKQCERIPLEKQSIEDFAKTVDKLCEDAPEQAVKIHAYGSAWVDLVVPAKEGDTTTRYRSFSFKAEIELIDIS